MIFDEFKYKLTTEKRLLFYIAQSILGDNVMAEQAAQKAQSLCERGRWSRTLLDPSILAVIMAKEAAIRIYPQKQGAKSFRDNFWTYTKPNQKPPNFDVLQEMDSLMLCLGLENLDILLLCVGGTLTQREAAFLLSIPPEEAETRLESARNLLTEFLGEESQEEAQAEQDAPGSQEAIPDSQGEEMEPSPMNHQAIDDAAIQEAVMAMASRILESLPHNLPRTKEVIRQRSIHAVAGFAALDVTAILLVAALLYWCGAFVKDPLSAQPVLQQTQSQGEISSSAPQSAEEASLNSLYYQLTYLPRGFRLVEHLRDSRSSQMHYSNENGDSIAFIQQMSETPIEGFSALSGAYETVEFRGHPAAYRSQEDLQQVYWYNENYCYTVYTSLSREEAMHLAQGAGLGAPSTSLLKVPLMDLPEVYTPRLAQENGDAVLGTATPIGTEQIAAFYKATLEGKEAAVRITDFKEDQIARITDLEFRDGHIYYTRDEHRDPNSEQPWEVGMEFESAVMKEENGSNILYLESAKWGDPFQVVAYKQG